MTIKFVITPTTLVKGEEVKFALRVAKAGDEVIVPKGIYDYCLRNIKIPEGVKFKGTASPKPLVVKGHSHVAKEPVVEPLTSEYRIEKLMTEIESADFRWRISWCSYKNVTGLIENIVKDDTFIDFVDVLREKPSYLVYVTLVRMRKIANKKLPELEWNRLDKALVAYAYAIIVVKPAKLPPQLVEILQSAPNAYWSRIMAKYIETTYNLRRDADKESIEELPIVDFDKELRNELRQIVKEQVAKEKNPLSTTKQLHFDDGFCDMKAVDTFMATIYIGQRNAKTRKLVSYEFITHTCQQYCDEVGLCVAVTPTRFIYTDGNEPGATVGLMYYPRDPKPRTEIKRKALVLARRLMRACNQKRVSVVFPDETMMLTNPELADD